MAEKLNETAGRAVPGKHPEQPAKFDHDLIDAIEHQERLKIWHLGRYANWSGMPPSAILLMAQIASHLRDGTAEDIALAKTVAAAVRDVCDYVVEHADRLAAADADALLKDAASENVLAASVRSCVDKRASEVQQRDDARQIAIVRQLIDQYPAEAKQPYKNHASKRFASKQDSNSQN